MQKNFEVTKSARDGTNLIVTTTAGTMRFKFDSKEDANKAKKSLKKGSQIAVEIDDVDLEQLSDNVVTGKFRGVVSEAAATAAAAPSKPRSKDF